MKQHDMARRRLIPMGVAKISSAAWFALFAGLAGIFYAMQSDILGAQWSALLQEVQSIQRELHGQLATALRSIRAEGTAAAWSLVSLSFFYGIFHAAGPGHGKVVISTYLLTQESQLRRGLLLSVIASLCQGATAIVVVTGCVTLLGFSMRQVQGAATDLEMVSYGLVALVGLMLVLSRARRLVKHNWQRPKHGHTDHDHPESVSHGHGHGHDGACSSCGHAHGPSRKDLDRPLSWRGLAGMIASIGLRPCSGALVVLLVAHSLNLSWAGVGAVVAMSIGTAITVSMLAVLSVYARKTSLRLAEALPDHTSRIGMLIDVAGMIGGLIIMLAGILLFQALWSAPVHPFA